MSLVVIVGIAIDVALVVILLTIAWIGLRSARKPDYRANALLRELLTPDQYRQFNSGYVEVPSSIIDNRVYRIPRKGSLVKVFDSNRVKVLCLQPVEPLPDGDRVGMHLLMIKANEREYLKKANLFDQGVISDPLL